MHTQLYIVIRVRVLSGLDTWSSLVSCVNVDLLNARAFLGYISGNFPYLFFRNFLCRFRFRRKGLPRFLFRFRLCFYSFRFVSSKCLPPFQYLVIHFLFLRKRMESFLFLFDLNLDDMVSLVVILRDALSFLRQ
jgi:hypothetical protein